MENPRFLFCDSDALVQIFVTKLLRILKQLSLDFAITAVIVPEVEVEIRRLRRQRFEPFLQKAVDEGCVKLFDDDQAESLLAEVGYPERRILDLLEKIQDLGSRLARHVGRGEAYSHAAGQYLSCPILSNDTSAVTTLRRHRLQTAVPVLHSFDLFCFGHSVGWIEESEFKALLQDLDAANERRHYHFRDAKWKSLLRTIGDFDCLLRLFDPPDRKAEHPKPPRTPTDTLYLTGKT